jgi:hypothetical protein
MLDPQESDIGRKVLYRTRHDDIEEGVLVSFNSAYVFIRYGSAGWLDEYNRHDRR